MSVSARRRRRRVRLGLIFGVLILIVAGVGVRYLMVRGNPAEVPVDARRETGLAAFAAGDDAQVMDQLGPYVRAHADDTEAVFALASTQLKHADDEPALLLDAVSGLRRVLRDQPNHEAAAELLLPIFIDFPAGVEEEGLRIADRLLRRDPDHRVALRARAVLMPRTGRDAEALAATSAYLQIDPTDVKVHRLVLDVMKRQLQTNASLIDYAQSLKQSDPQQPAFDLVLAYARLITDDRAAAAEVLKGLTEQSPPDEAFAYDQIALMDAAGLFGEVLQYLDKLHAQQSTALPMDELIRRRFEAGRGPDALALIDTLNAPTTTQRTLRALVLMGQQKNEPVQKIVADFEAGGSRADRAMAALLQATANADTQGLDAVIEAGRQVKDAGVNNPYLDLVVAEAYAQTGQPDRAETRYEAALRQRPCWAGPCLGLAELSLEQDNAPQALGYAVAALQRQPSSINARIALARAFADDPAALSAGQKSEVLSLIDQVQQARPGEPRTLALRIAVLAGTGERDAAIKAMRDALAADPPLDQPAMVTLIESAKRYNLDRDGETQAAYVERFGQTLAITMVQAQQRLDQGDPAGALAVFDAARPATADAQWDTNRALLLERMADPRATEAWATAGSQHPDNLKVQQAILRSAAAWQDRSAIKQTIQRLRNLTGEDDPRWRIEQARWLLSSDDPLAVAAEADKLLDAALKIESDSVEALSMRGRCQRLMGNPRLAVSLLSQAVTLSPGDAEARAELALAQRESGSAEVALDTARTAASLEGASANAQRRAAQLMIDQGQYTEAATVLGRLYETGDAEPRDVFTLVQLYRQTQQTPRAMKLIEEMLAAPSPAAVALAADLYAQADQPDMAESALAMLDSMELTEEEVLRIRAAHASAYGDTDAADAAWVALVEASPTDAAAWSQLISFRLRSGRVTQGIAAAQDAAAQVPGDAGLAAVAQHGDLIARTQEVPGAAGLSLAILENEMHRAAAVEALRLLDPSRTSGETKAALADRLVQLAEASPGFETLWGVSVSYQFETGRQAKALARAAAARQRFPDSPRSARLSAEVLAATGQWREALLEAEAWKSLSAGGAGSRWEADTLAARMQRELGRANQGAAVLSPYVASVKAEPLARPSLTQELALSWAASGQTESAKQLLDPLLDRDVRWRMAWLEAAVSGVSNTREAGKWLETLDAAIPDEAGAERAALAQAWWSLGMRDSVAAYRQHGREMAEALAQRPDASAGLWLFVGSAAEMDGDLSAAASAYRRALAIDPALAAANNNLAMVIAATDGDLNEAITLAQKAVAAEPNEPNYHDTLAHVLQQAGRVDEARQAIQRAIELDPGNPAWRSRLNEMAVVE